VGTRDTDSLSSRGEYSRTANTVVEYAMKYLGTPYVTAGSDPSGFDCSGFTYYVFKNFGVDLNRTAAGQSEQGIPVSKGDLQPGDLVFFSYYGNGLVSHVGIYTGNGQIIHASEPGSDVKVSDLNSSYFTENYMCARRVIR
jgi:cell wall-associated NlpC family hydrolase